jgi:hypothetical protein
MILPMGHNKFIKKNLMNFFHIEIPNELNHVFY